MIEETNMSEDLARMPERILTGKPVATPRVLTGNAIPSRQLSAATQGSVVGGLYVPTGVSKSTAFQRRIAIVGPPGSGKTTSCLTFPNRVWLNFDNKLPSGEQEMKFWNTDFCNTIVKPNYNFPNRRDAFKTWLFKNLFQFTEEQTVILDSWTMMQNAFDKQTQAEYDEMPTVNDWWMPKQKKKYSREICECLKEAKCLVVVLFHETEKWESGKPSGKLGPVMDGSFQNEIFGFFTDVWHQRSHIYERDSKGKVVKVDNTPVVKVITHKNDNKWVWFWQLEGDDSIDLNCNPELSTAIRKHNIGLVPADYAEVQKIYKMYD